MANNYKAARSLITADQGPLELKWASPQQQELFEYGPAPLCASGGYGAAKTVGFILKILTLSSMYPRNRGAICRRVWEELKQTTMESFFKFCPPQAYSYGGRRADSEKILRFNNGSEVLWLHLDNPDTENIIGGLEINWFLFDQAEEIREELFEKMDGRLGRWDKAQVPEEVLRAYGGIEHWPWKSESGRPIPPTYAMLTCNPDHELHWIYKRFHPDSSEHWEKRLPDPDAPTSGRLVSYNDLGYKLITMDSRDNRFLPKQNLSKLLARDSSFIRRYVRGEWGIPEGTIHTVLPDSIVSGTPEILAWIQSYCALYRLLDHGDTSPTSCLWMAVDPSGNLIFYREYYKPGELISYHRREITAMSRGEAYRGNFADPQIFYKISQTKGGRYSTADEYADTRDHTSDDHLSWLPADNNEMGTRDRISEYLAFDPGRVNPFTKRLGAPRAYFITSSPSYHHGIQHALSELRAQRRKKIGMTMGRPIFSDDRDENVDDHAYDCIRYGVASRPHGIKAASTPPPPNSFTAIRKRIIRFKKDRGTGPRRSIRGSYRGY